MSENDILSSSFYQSFGYRVRIMLHNLRKKSLLTLFQILIILAKLDVTVAKLGVGISYKKHYLLSRFILQMRETKMAKPWPERALLFMC